MMACNTMTDTSALAQALLSEIREATRAVADFSKIQD